MTNIFKGTKSYRSTEQRLEELGKSTEIVPDTGAIERAAGAFEFQFRRTPFGKDMLTGSVVKDQRALHDKYDTGVFPKYQFSTSATGGQGMRSGEEILTENDDRIKELQKQYPKAGFLTSSEVEAKMIEEQRQIQNYNQRLSEGSHGISMGAGFVGYVGGFLADPINALSMAPPLIGVRAGSAVGNFVRVGTSEALIDAALQLRNKPTELDIRRKLGEEVTTGQIAKEVATEIGIAGVLGGAIGAAVGKFAKVSTPENPVSQQTVDKAQRLRRAMEEGSVKATQELRDHVSMVEEAADILQDTPQGMSQAEHAAKYSKAHEDAASGREIDVEGEASAKEVEESATQAERQQESTGQITEEEYIDNTIAEAEELLKTNDVVFRETDSDGNVISETSARDVVRKINREEKAVDAVNNCLIGGTDVAQ